MYTDDFPALKALQDTNIHAMASSTSTPTTTYDKTTAQVSTRDFSASPRGGSLSISTSTPHSMPDTPSQSPHQAQTQPQQPSPHRTFSFPITPTSPSVGEVLATGRSPTTPRSAGYQSKNLTFERAHELKTTMTTPAVGSKKEVDMVKRRHSHDPNRVNVYTECGRHSDDWLFGGWSVSGAVKKIWDRERKE